MARRPALSILLITDDEAARADFSAGARPRLRGLWRGQRRVQGTLATAVELAASLGPKLGRRVAVLASEVWTQTIALPANSVRGLSEAELAQALAFEVESLSGIESFQSQLGFREVGGDAEHCMYWIAQVDAGQLDAVDQAITSRGGSLAEMSSPIGLPAGALGPSDQRRLEFWPQAVCLTAPGMPPLVSNSDPRSDRWRRALIQWEAEHGRADISHLLLAPGASDAPPLEPETAVETVNLTDAAALEHWMTAWAGQLAGSAATVPTLRPPRKPMSRQTRMAISLAGTAAMLAFCIGHWTYVERETQLTRDRIDALKALAEEVKQNGQQQTAAEKEHAELEDQLAGIGRQCREVETFTRSGRDQMPMLLAVLSQLHQDELMITRLATDAQGASVSGLALRSDAATHLAEQLRTTLEGRGWEVQPSTQEGQSQLAGGGPWEFTIALRDVQPSIVESHREINASDSNATLTMTPSTPSGGRTASYSRARRGIADTER